MQPAGELSDRRKRASASCWTSRTLDPPASPLTGASRWSRGSWSSRLHAGRRWRPAAAGGRWRWAVRQPGGLPWFFAFGARWRLLDDALEGVPFAWRGDRRGVWATAPVTGALATLVLAAALGFPTCLALLACLAGARAHTALIAWCRGPLRARDPARPHRPRAALQAHRRQPRRPYESEAGVGVGSADGDLEVQVRAGREAGLARRGRPGADGRRSAPTLTARLKVGVAGVEAVAVVEDDREAPAVVVAGEDHAAGGGGGDEVPWRAGKSRPAWKRLPRGP